MKHGIPDDIFKDKKLAKHVTSHGPVSLGEWKRPKQPFHSLIRAIIHQQVSGSAAASILKKFQDQFEGRLPSPKQVLEISTDKLRAAGLSQSKVIYVKDLAKHFAEGAIKPRQFRSMSNEEIVEHLTRVKGIGVWTAQMFLIFTLKRPDILPTLDLGIRKGFQIVYGLKRLPEHKQMERLAYQWRKHASLASLYLWKAADTQKGRKN
ncbi:MAG: hypothetical protein RIQ56_766 [Candidatus Parcubacteria bacterium]